MVKRFVSSHVFYIIIGAFAVFGASNYWPEEIQIAARLHFVGAAIGLFGLFIYAGRKYGDYDQVGLKNGHLSKVFFWGAASVLSFGGPAFILLFIDRYNPMYNVFTYLVAACFTKWLVAVFNYAKKIPELEK